MRDIDECWDIIRSLNEQAHDEVDGLWYAAELEEDSEEAERLREAASEEQAYEFRDNFENLDAEFKQAILYYKDTQPSHDMVLELKIFLGE